MEHILHRFLEHATASVHMALIKVWHIHMKIQQKFVWIPAYLIHRIHVLGITLMPVWVLLAHILVTTLTHHHQSSNGINALASVHMAISRMTFTLVPIHLKPVLMPAWAICGTDVLVQILMPVSATLAHTLAATLIHPQQPPNVTHALVSALMAMIKVWRIHAKIQQKLAWMRVDLSPLIGALVPILMLALVALVHILAATSAHHQQSRRDIDALASVHMALIKVKHTLAPIRLKLVSEHVRLCCQIHAVDTIRMLVSIIIACIHLSTFATVLVNAHLDRTRLLHTRLKIRLRPVLPRVKLFPQMIVEYLTLIPVWIVLAHTLVSMITHREEPPIHTGVRANVLMDFLKE